MFVFIIVGILLVIGAINILLLRFLNRRWWRVRSVRMAAFLLPVAGVFSLLIGFAGFYASKPILIAAGMTTASLVFVLSICFLVSIPFSGVLNTWADYSERRKKRVTGDNSLEISSSRRMFLRRSALIFPAVMTTSGIAGFVTSFGRVKVYELPMFYEELPAQLEGFRILHLSDMHLGRYFQPGDLERLLMDAEDLKPDITLLTGDGCDVNPLLKGTLDMVSSLKTSFGGFASIGNHEYYHGVRFVRTAHSRSEIPLLINEGHTLNVRGVDIFVGGADDPASLWKNENDFLRSSVRETLSDAPSDAFKIIMSHRPQGFFEAARRGVELTLAGHTHGGQIGIRGRSIFELDDPPNYFWGHYVNGKSQLYTSAGAGHWFPFRLGCPAEAPVIVLKKG